MFYGALGSQAELVREWGSGAADGFRLYRIAPAGPWTRPLQEDELARLTGGPLQTWFLTALGALYTRCGQADLAVLLYRQGLSWDPNAAGLYNNLAQIYVNQGEYLEASKVFDSGLQRAPRAFELLFNYGRLCVQQAVYGRGEEMLRRAVALRPDFSWGHYELARVFLAQGKSDLGRQALQRYLTLAPGATNRAQVEDVLRQIQSGRGATALPAAGEEERGPAAPSDSAAVLPGSASEAPPDGGAMSAPAGESDGHGAPRPGAGSPDR